MLHAPQVIIESYQGAYLVLDPEAPNWVNTNQYGVDAIRMIDGHKSARRIIADLTHSRQGSAEPIKQDLIEFFNKIFEIGLIAKEPFKYLPFTGRYKYLNYTWLNELSICTSTHSDFFSPLFNNNQDLQLNEYKLSYLIEQAIDLGCRSLMFIGGELFLLEFFPALIKKYTNQGLSLTIMTGGDLISDEILADLSPDINIIVNLPGLSAKLNAAIRGSSLFDATIGGLKKLVNTGFNPTAQTMVSNANISDLIPTAELLTDIGVKKIKLNWQRQSEVIKKPDNNRSIIDIRLLLSVLKKLDDDTDASGVNLLNKEFLNDNLYQRGVKTDLCSGGVDSLAVFADGECYPCHWLFGCDQFKLGNINSRPLKEIWHSSVQLNKMRRNTAQKNHKCYLCHLKYLCGGLAKCYASCAHLSAEEFNEFIYDEVSCQAFSKIIYQTLHAPSPADNAPDFDCPVVYDSINNVAENSEQNSLNYNKNVKSFKPFCV